MIRGLAPLAAFLCATAAFAQQATNPAELFGIRESVEHIDISPDGTKVVFLQPGPGRTTIVFVSDIAGGSEPRNIIRSDGDPERFRWCNFVTNDRLICQVVGMSTVDGVLASFSRLISFDTDGRNPTSLGQRSSFYDARARQFDGSILDWTGGTSGSVLMTRELVPEAGRMGTRITRTADGLAVDRIDVRTLRSDRVEPANNRATGYMSDGRGTVRMMVAQNMRGSTGQLSSQIEHYYRTPGDRDWRSFGTYDIATGAGMLPLAIDSTLNVVYVLQKLNGRDALYRVKLDGSMASELVYANAEVDVDGVIRTSRGERVIGVSFAEESRRAIYFEPDYQAMTQTLRRALPNLPLLDFESASADGNRVIVHAGADNDAGRYFVFDRAARSLNELLMVRPQLENVPLANVRNVTYPAADGTVIPAYLTLPPGQADARNLPVVIMPHGGPAARDTWSFDWLAQFLAHRGYAVLQANYRGSAGYGEQWLQQNGFRSWRASIGDINAGARWLAAQGVGDPNRMAILGWSYGGYAALQSGAVEPSLFRAIVAIAPVTDLQQLKQDAQNYTNARITNQYIGDGPHIREGSPLQNARSITAPVLLFHGDRDINVTVTHSRRMNDALRDAGKSSELVVLPGLEHDLADSAVRTQMLTRIGTFLEEALRPRAQ